MIKRLKKTTENNQKIAQAILNHRQLKKVKDLAFNPILKWSKPK